VEFIRLLESVLDSVDRRTAEVLFMKLDVNGDESISVKEFALEKEKKEHEEKPTKPSTMGYAKTAYEIQNALTREGMDHKVFDKRGRGLCLVSTFKEILSNDLGIDQLRAKSLIEKCTSTTDAKSLDVAVLCELLEDVGDAMSLLQGMSDSVHAQDDPDATIRDLFKDYDANENGTLELREFQQLVRELDAAAKQKCIDTLYAIMDANQDGRLQLEELKVQLKKKSIKSSTRFDK
jgi:Ca2+-binding EF-hand superfamily protein